MRVGNWVPLYRRIVPIPQRLAMAFGLTEGSQLHLAPFQDAESRHRFDYEIMVSPVPVQSWNSACRLSVRLRDCPGALAVATRFLRKHRINILLTESCSTYKDRAHWDAICDVAETIGFSDLRQEQPTFYERSMQKFLQGLTDKLDSFIESPEHQRFFLTGLEKNAQFTPLTGLNDASFHANFSRSVTLRYKAGGIQIPDSFANYISSACGLDAPALPAYAMVTGNTEQRYLRIYFIRDHLNMFRAVIRNELRGLAGGGVGVLNQFLEALPKDINIIKLSNYIIEKNNDVEKGEIELIGHWSNSDSARQEMTREHMKGELSRVLQSIDIEDVEGVRHGPLLILVELVRPDVIYPRVFISYSTRVETEKLQFLMNLLWDNHFEPVLGTDFGQAPLSESVDGNGQSAGPSMVQAALRAIRTCVAFISLQVKRADFCIEPKTETEIRRFIVPPWTVAEEAFAWASGIETMIRLKDKAVEEPRYNRDIYALEFDSDPSYRAAVEQVIEYLNSFRQSSQFAAAKQKAREAMYQKTYLPTD